MYGTAVESLKRCHVVIRSVLILALLAMPASLASAALRLAPARPLTPDEQLSFSTGWATAICRATVVSMTNELIFPPQSAGRYKVRRRYLTIRPSQWLKGGGSMAPQSVGAHPGDDDYFDAFKEPHTWGQEVVLFLQPVPRHLGDSESDGHFAYHPATSWLINPDPAGIRGGAIVLTPATAKSQTDAVLEEVERARPHRLAKEADLVVVGHLSPERKLTSRETFFTREVVIDSVIAGDAPRGTVIVKTLVVDDLPVRPSILFLKRTGKDYKVLRPYAAMSPIATGVATRFGKTLKVLANEVRLARRGM